MTAAVVVGAAFGLGVHLLWRGLVPPRPTLAERVAELLEPQRPAATSDRERPRGLQGRVEQWMGDRLVGLFVTAGVDPRSKARQQDLRVTGGRIEALVAEKVILGVTGVCFPLLVALGLQLGGISVSGPVLIAGSALLGAVGFILPDISLRQRAKARRKSFRYALSAFLDLVSVSLAGGGLVQGSLQDAASVGRGWAFDEFRRPLEITRTKGHSSWDEVGRLGSELGVPELEELAASLTLAGAEGARVRQSLMAKAESLRQRRMTDAEGEANESSERMVLPLVLLGLGFLLFLGYPAIDQVLGGL